MQGKTAEIPKSLGARAVQTQEGPDPLPDHWGEWLVQNAKGRVRVIGGLEVQEPKSPFLGSVEHSSGGSAGTEKWSINDDYELASTLVARSQDIRGQMSKHMQEGTVHAGAQSLTNEGRTVYNKLKTLSDESAAKKESLEEEHLTSDSSATEVVEEISIVERQCNLLNCEIERWEAKVPPVPMPS